MQFVQPRVNDLVFDKKQQVEGKVVSIELQNNTAEIEVDVTPENKETMQSKLMDLIVINKREHEIKIKYFNKDIDKLSKISKGDWIDLRSAKTVELKQGEFALIPLGVGMKLPDGYEANIVPRSSTFKNYGIIQTNHFAVIDNSYSGDNDQWMLPVYATRDTTINFNDRVCQFRINKKMPSVTFTEVEKLDETSRGGFGSTGVK